MAGSEVYQQFCRIYKSKQVDQSELWYFGCRPTSTCWLHVYGSALYALRCRSAIIMHVSCCFDDVNEVLQLILCQGFIDSEKKLFI